MEEVNITLFYYVNYIPLHIIHNTFFTSYSCLQIMLIYHITSHHYTGSLTIRSLWDLTLLQTHDLSAQGMLYSIYTCTVYIIRVYIYMYFIVYMCINYIIYVYYIHVCIYITLHTYTCILTILYYTMYTRRYILPRLFI